VNPLVSVLVPVYNCAEYLAACLDSILAQSYIHFELIIVNNCSTDTSLAMAKEYAKKNARITLHDNETFVNAEQNHNIAARLISAKSEYVKFVQADDGLFPECLKLMVDLAEKNLNVGIVGAFGINDAGKVLWQSLPLDINVVLGKKLSHDILLGSPNIFGTPTTLLIRSKFLRSATEFYLENDTHADTDSCFRILQSADFGFVHQILIYRRSRNDSLSSFSQRMNTYNPHQIKMLLQYGPSCLSSEEFQMRQKYKFNEYYDYLAYNLLKNRGKEFWNFHRKELLEIGKPLNVNRLTTLWIWKILKRVGFLKSLKTQKLK